MSQVSCGHLSFLDPTADDSINLVEAAAQFSVVENLDGNDLSQAGSQDSIIGASAKQGGAQAQPGHLITVSPRDPLDQTMQSQPAQVISHLARGHVFRGLTQQGSPIVPQIAVGKTS